MAPKAVLCSLCGGKFFKSSLAHHQKVCREKVGRQCQECAYCHSLWPALEMDDHIRTCAAARAAGARPTGVSAALAKRLCDYQHRLENGIPEITEERSLGGSGMGDVAEYAEENDTRIACQICGRKFAMDRIGKHQAICQKIASKPRPRPKIIAKSTAPMPAPMQSDWRRKSEDFRAAAKAGRSCGTPTWGKGSSGPDSLRRTGGSGMDSLSRTGQRPAAGSALAAIRQKASPDKHLKVPIPQMSRSGAFRRASAPDATLDGSVNRSPRGNSGRQNRSRSTGAIRATNASDLDQLPAWGSPGSTRYGRECITSCPVRTTPHNTSWGGCTRPVVQEKEGIESNRCSSGNPLDRSWLYESCDNMRRVAAQKNGPASLGPRAVSEAPVLLGRCRGGNEKRRVHFA